MLSSLTSVFFAVMLQKQKLKLMHIVQHLLSIVSRQSLHAINDQAWFLSYKIFLNTESEINSLPEASRKSLEQVIFWLHLPGGQVNKIQRMKLTISTRSFENVNYRFCNNKTKLRKESFSMLYFGFYKVLGRNYQVLSRTHIINCI